MNILQLANKLKKTAVNRLLKEEQYNIQNGINRTLDDYIDHEINLLRTDVKIAKKIQDMLIEEGIMNKEKNNDKLSDNNYWFITLRPNIGSFEHFKNVFELTYLPSLNFHEYIYCYEQKGENIESIGTGFHVHLIIHLNEYIQLKDLVRKSKCQWSKYFGKSKGAEVPDAFIDIKKISCKSQFNNCLNYMKGEKKQEDKLYAVEQDKVWREKNNLKDLYIRGFQDQDPLL